MSWTLEFFRPAGDGELLLEEVEALFARMPRFTSEPPEEGETGAGDRDFHYHNPISGVRFTLQFRPEEFGREEIGPEEPEGGGAGEEEPEEPEEPAGHWPTPLCLRVPYLQGPEAAQEAMPIAAEVALHLNLEVRDPQSGQEAPGRADVDALIRSYLERNEEVTETAEYLRRTGRRAARIVLGLLAFLILALVAVIALSRGSPPP